MRSVVFVSFSVHILLHLRHEQESCPRLCLSEIAVEEKVAPMADFVFLF